MQRSLRNKKIYLSLFEKQLIRHAKAIHCLGESEIKGLHQIFPKKKYILIPNGQDIEALQFTPQPLDKKGKLVWGFCGRIDIYTKGLDLLVKAFALWNRKRNKNVSLWLIGDGSERQELEELCRELQLTDDVKFLGSRFGEEKLNIMSHMDVFFHPSRNEGIPTAVLEASGMGIPCVVSHESNLGTAINAFEAGIGLPQNDEQQLIQAMEVMYQHYIKGSDIDYAENSKRMIREHYNWSYIAQQLIDNYKS